MTRGINRHVVNLVLAVVAAACFTVIDGAKIRTKSMSRGNKQRRTAEVDPIVIVNANFNSGTDGFVYSDDTFEVRFKKAIFAFKSRSIIYGGLLLAKAFLSSSNILIMFLLIAQ